MKQIALITGLAVLMAIPGMSQEVSAGAGTMSPQRFQLAANTGSSPDVLLGDGSVKSAAELKPKMLYGSASTTEAGTGSYEVGVKFSKWSDATALFRPSRWASALDTGGIVSWLNPAAWSEAPGRTALVLLGEAVVVGGVAVGAGGGGGGGGGSSTYTGGIPSGGGDGSGGTTPPPPLP